jgi:hypothetical protein
MTEETMDAPFYVDSYPNARENKWAIKRNDAVVCTTGDANMAYKLVELLNQDVRMSDTPRSLGIPTHRTSD